MRVISRRKLKAWAPGGVLGGALGLTLLLASAAAVPATQSRESERSQHSRQSRREAAANPLDPPPQMHGLYAMLGTYKCPEQAPPGDAPEVGYETNTLGLNGHYLDTAVDIPGVLHGRGTMGWNPVDGTYIAFYEDDWGSSSAATSPGWAGGHLVFTGDIVQVAAPSPSGHAKGGRLSVSNDYRISGPGHYVTVQTIRVPGGRTIRHTYDCRRT